MLVYAHLNHYGGCLKNKMAASEKSNFLKKSSGSHFSNEQLHGPP